MSLGLLAILFVSRAYFPSEDAPTGSGLLWTTLMIGVTAIGIASLLLAGKTRLRWSWADGAVIALMMLVGWSVSNAPERRPAITMAWEWAGLGMMYLLARNLPRTRAESSALAAAAVCTAVAVSAYGFYQSSIEIGKLRRLYEFRPDLVLGRLQLTPGSPQAEALKQRLMYSNDVFSTFALANSLAGFLVGPMALVFAVALENLRREGKGPRFVAYAMAAVPGMAMLTCLVMTKSRSAWIGLALALVVLAWRARRVLPAKVLAVAGLGLVVTLGGLVAAGLATKQLDVEVLTQSSKSLKYRWEYWVGAWGVITDAPSPFASTGLSPMPAGFETTEVASTSRRNTFWTGLGPANFGGPYLRHKLPEASEEVQDPHNMVLEVWVTAGVFAVIALGLALAIGLRETLGPARLPVPAVEPANPKLYDPMAPPSTVSWLVGMASLGWVAVWVLGKLDPIGDLDNLFRWVILGSAWGLAVFLGAPIWRRRPIPAAGLGVATLAIAVNLLAAGGIGMPSVAMMLWMTLALGMNLREDRPCGRLRDLGGLGPAVGLACVWAMLAGTFYGAVSPFWKSEAAIEEGDYAMARQPPNVELARNAYTRAIEADHYSTRPWLAMAELEYEAIKDPRLVRRKGAREQQQSKVLIAMSSALSPPWRNPDNLNLRRRQAAFARQLLADLPPEATVIEILTLRRKVVVACRQAVGIYPTSAGLRAELASANADIGMFPDAVREGQVALRLDAITPHQDKKLGNDQRAFLQSQIKQWEEKAKAPPPKASDLK